MHVPVRLPELGDGPVEFGLWLVEIGERVYEGDRIAEVLMPGTSIDVASPATGTLIERMAYPRDVVTSGQVLGYVETEFDA